MAKAQERIREAMSYLLQVLNYANKQAAAARRDSRPCPGGAQWRSATVIQAAMPRRTTIATTIKRGFGAQIITTVNW